MVAEYVVVGKGVPEEVAAVEAAVDGGLLVGVAHERRHDRQVGVDLEAGGHATLRRDDAVVVVDPLPRLVGVDERERQGSDPLLGGEMDRLAAAARHPERRVRALERLRDDVARRHLYEAPVVPRERRLYEHAGDGVERLVPLVALLGPVDKEAAELGLRRRLARSELDPSVGDEVEGGDAFGDACRMVEPGR